MYLNFRKAAANNDMDTIKRIMANDDYKICVGKEAIGIAMACNYDDIVYEILSYPGALDEFFNHHFKVDNGLRLAVKKYKSI